MLLKNIFIGLLPIVLLACDHSSETIKFKTDRYNRLIWNTAVSCPEYDLSGYTAKFTKTDSFARYQILDQDAFIQDDSLSLSMARHSWTLAGGGYPHSIVYVSISDTIEYAFPFLDEYYYRLNIDTLKNTQLRYIMKKKMNFGAHLNYVLSIYDQSNFSKNKYLANRLVTLLCDSIMDMKEYTTKDTAAFRIQIQQLLNSGVRSDRCDQMSKINIEKMVMAAAESDTRFFSPREGAQRL